MNSTNNEDLYFRAPSLSISDNEIRTSLSANGTTVNWGPGRDFFWRENTTINNDIIETPSYPFSESIYNSLSEGDIVFLDMKIENKGGYLEITQTFIDKKNYKEVIKKYKCHNISTGVIRSIYNNNITECTIKLDDIYNETEYKKDI